MSFLVSEKKKEFLSTEAEDDCPMLEFADDDEEKITDELDNVIDDTLVFEEDVSFYREMDPSNVNNYPRFNEQTRNPLEAVYSDNESYFGEDQQPELFAPDNRKSITFDRLKGFEKSVEIFKSTLMNFEQVEKLPI